jgi:hypothetical protein
MIKIDIKYQRQFLKSDIQSAKARLLNEQESVCPSFVKIMALNDEIKNLEAQLKATYKRVPKNL